MKSNTETRARARNDDAEHDRDRDNFASTHSSFCFSGRVHLCRDFLADMSHRRQCP